MKNIFTLALLLFGLSFANAQTDQEKVNQVIHGVFDAMRAGDSTALVKYFIGKPGMKTVYKKEGKVLLHTGTLNDFAVAVGTPHDEVYNEVIDNLEIKIDGPLASAWVPYKFYIGEKFSHCGVNVFELVKIDGNWKVSSIIDTRRQENCLF